MQSQLASFCWYIYLLKTQDMPNTVSNESAGEHRQCLFAEDFQLVIAVNHVFIIKWVWFKEKKLVLQWVILKTILSVFINPKKHL